MTRTFGQALVAFEPRIGLDPPEQIGTVGAGQIPHDVAEEISVAQAEHAWLQGAQYFLGQGDLARRAAGHLGGE